MPKKSTGIIPGRRVTKNMGALHPQYDTSKQRNTKIIGSTVKTVDKRHWMVRCYHSHRPSGIIIDATSNTLALFVDKPRVLSRTKEILGIELTVHTTTPSKSGPVIPTVTYPHLDPASEYRYICI